MTKQRDMRLAMMYAEELRQSVRGDCAPSSGLMLSVAALLERFGLPDEPPADPLRENLIAALAAADAEEYDEERWAEFSRVFVRAHLNRTAPHE